MSHLLSRGQGSAPNVGFRGVSIGVKFIAAMVLIALTFTAAVYLVFERAIIPSQTKAMVNMAYGAAHGIQDTSPYLSVQALQRIIEHSNNSKSNLSYILITDTRGKALAHSEPSRIGMFFTDAGTLSAARDGRESIGPFTRDEKDYTSPVHGERVIDISLPRYDLRGNLVGAICVGLSLRSIEAMQADYRHVLLGVVGLVLAVIVGTSTWLMRRVIVPIRSLSLAARDMAKGSAPAVVSTSGTDEIGVLGLEFTAMAEKVSSLIGDLRDRERDLQEHLDRMTVLSGRIAPDGELLMCNETAANLIGQRPEELVGRKFWDTGWWDYSEDVQRRLISSIAKAAAGENVRYEEAIATSQPDGYMIAELRFTPVRNGDGGIAYIVTEGHDITDRKRAEEALRDSEQRLAEIISFLPDPTFAIDTEGRVIVWNRAIEELSGTKAEDLLGKGDYAYSIPFYGCRRPMLVDSILHPDEEHPGIPPYSRLERNGSTIVGEGYTPALRPGGAHLWGKCALLYDAGGRVTGAIETVRDTTEKKQAEDSLRNLNRTLRVLSSVNEVLVRAESEDALLTDTCRVMVEIGGYRMVWIGYAQHDEARTVIPVASAGYVEGYFDGAPISWGENDAGMGPSATAIRTGKVSWVANIASTEGHRPWRASAIERGYASTLSLPIVCNGQTIGALGLYSGEESHFDESEARLLTELVADLSYGIAALRAGAELRELESHKREFYRKTILSATEGKLIICERSEIKGVAGIPAATFRISRPEDLSRIRRSIAEIAGNEGMESSRIPDFILTIGEATTNTLKHAGGGSVSVHRRDGSLMAVVSDTGRGIDAINLPEVALKRGYTTAVSLGMGYKAMISTADRVYLATGQDGTTVALDMKLVREPTNIDIGNIPDTWGDESEW